MADNFQQVLDEATDAWMKLDGVVAVAQGKKEGKDSIIVFVAHKSPAIESQIPPYYKGIPVDIRETGVISAGG